MNCAEGVVAHAAGDPDLHADFDQVHGRVRRAAAQAELNIAGRLQLARIRQAIDRRTGHVGEEDPGTQTIDSHGAAPCKLLVGYASA